MNKSTVAFSGQVTGFLEGLVGNAALDLSPRPSRVVAVAPGSQVAFDDSESGLLWGRLVSVRHTPGDDKAKALDLRPANFPTFTAIVELGVVRCAAVFNDNTGTAPSPAQITEDGVQGVDDMAALLSALRCHPRVRSIVEWSPIGPEGGYAGGAWQFVVSLPNCLEC